MSRDFEVGTVRSLRRVDRQSCKGLIYITKPRIRKNVSEMVYFVFGGT